MVGSKWARNAIAGTTKNTKQYRKQNEIERAYLNAYKALHSVTPGICPKWANMFSEKLFSGGIYDDKAWENIPMPTYPTDILPENDPENNQTRIGRSINIKSLDAIFQVKNTSYDNTGAVEMLLRVVWVLNKQPQDVSQAGNIFEAGTSNYTIGKLNFQAQYNLSNQDRYKILSDKIYEIKATSGFAPFTIQQKSFSEHLDLDIITTFEKDSTNEGDEQNAVANWIEMWVCAIARPGTGDGDTENILRLRTSIRTTFLDA